MGILDQIFHVGFWQIHPIHGWVYWTKFFMLGFDKFILFMDEYIGPNFSCWVSTSTKVSCSLKGRLGFLLRVKLVWKMNAQKLGLFEAWRFATFPQMIFFLKTQFVRLVMFWIPMMLISLSQERFLTWLAYRFFDQSETNKQLFMNSRMANKFC
jgi:hypothetical protein